MKNIYQSLHLFGILVMLNFGGIFMIRWTLHDELLLDHLIGFMVGLVALATGFIMKRRDK